MIKYSMTTEIPAADISWSTSAEYVIQILRYSKKPSMARKGRGRKANVSANAKVKGWKIEDAEGKGMKKGKLVEKWEQVNPGRFFIETVHDKGKRWPDHAFEEILILEEGLERGFSRVEGVETHVSCKVHEGERLGVEIWRRC
jgi:hypothetical protein